jgi:NAD(P)-dependent dehydrogenase (short-subunit alcohol dehydrogenase family)
MEIQGSVAVITGGASGIGRGTALALARRGADVVIADINQGRMEATSAEIAALGRRVLAVRCDVSRDADVDGLAARAIAEMGRVDILMNNAGVILRGALEEIAVADWEWIYGINVLGVVRGIRAFLPHMLERGSGYIVNTGSVAGMVALTGEGAPYVSSKFAVVGLTESLALYGRPRGIGVSLLCPGSVDTNLQETERVIGFGSPEQAAAEHEVARSVQGNRTQSSEEVGEAVVEGILHDRFFILPDGFHQPLIERRARDLSAFLEWRLSGVVATGSNDQVGRGTHTPRDTDRPRHPR